MSEKEYIMPKNQLPGTMIQLRGFGDFVRTVMRDWRVPGLAMAVIKENEIIYAGTEFLAKGSSGLSVEFQRDASGAVTGVVATLPYGVFHASKKG